MSDGKEFQADLRERRRSMQIRDEVMFSAVAAFAVLGFAVVAQAILVILSIR